MRLKRLDELDCRDWDAAIFDCDPAGPDSVTQDAQTGFRWPRATIDTFSRLLGVAKREREARALAKRD